MATPLDEATKQAVIAEAQNRANRFGISKEQALYNYAVENGIDNASVDTLMGFAQGSTDAWLKQRDAGTQASAPAVQQAAPQGNSSANLGMGGGQQQATTYQPLAPDHRAAVLAEAQNRATASGKSVQQELYDYAHNGGISNAGIDTMMGFAQGGTDAWLKQTSQQNNQQQQGNLGMGGGYNPQQNPYLRQMGVDVGNQMFDQWSRNTLPSIRSGAMAAGGFGGSRQGVVEANGINDMQRNYGQALTGMYGNDWSQQQGRNLQQQGLNNSYDLGLRSSDLGFGQLDANINQQNFNNNLAGANFGMGVYGMMNGMNQQGINSGTQMQNTPLNYFNQFNGNTNATGGMGGTQTGTQGTTSNGLSQGLGLGLAGGDFLTKYFTAV